MTSTHFEEFRADFVDATTFEVIRHNVLFVQGTRILKDGREATFHAPVLDGDIEDHKQVIERCLDRIDS
jgi:hypothetical protein